MIDTFRDIPELSIDATRLRWLAQRYLMAIRGQTTDLSRRKYAQKIEHFLAWADRQDNITEQNMADFAHHLRGSGLKKTTQADVIKRCRQMFTWAHRTGVAQIDFAIWLPKLRAAKPIFEPVAPADVEALLAVCTGALHAQRNQAFIALLAGAGLRLAEACALTRKDVIVYEDGTGILLVREGKGTKSRTVAFNLRWCAYLKAWLDTIPSDGPVFPSQKGGYLTTSGAHNEFKKITAKAGLALSCHSLRRFFATQWCINHPGRLKELQLQMGHADPGTTLGYVATSTEDIRALLRGTD